MRKKLNHEDVARFQGVIWDFYKHHGRKFPWRTINDPYQITVSEIMLQQTQTGRVILKFQQFIHMFPTVYDLACASLQDVLFVWQGLGYNRRAKYLLQTAKKIMKDLNGVIPSDPDILDQFPGIGRTTAASICAFAFNKPTLFVETNIRSVFIYHFLADESRVYDGEILALVEQTLDKSNPREWYYALMDYGVFLKRTCGVTNERSAHYIKQSRFEGSDRQIRGRILKILMEEKQYQLDDLMSKLNIDSERVTRIITALGNEGFIKIKDGLVRIESL